MPPACPASGWPGAATCHSCASHPSWPCSCYDDHIVTIELFTGQLILRDPKDIDHYHALASFFGGHALWKDAARDFISETAAHYRAAG